MLVGITLQRGPE